MPIKFFFSSKWRPRNCTHFICWITVLDIVKMISSFSGGGDPQNNMHFVLEIFRDNIFARNQSANIWSSLFISLYILLTCFPVLYIVVSSANYIVFQCSTQNGKRTRISCRKILIRSPYGRNSGAWASTHRNATRWVPPERKIKLYRHTTYTDTTCKASAQQNTSAETYRTTWIGHST